MGTHAEKMPPLPEHPEPQIMKWSRLELEAIRWYGHQIAIAINNGYDSDTLQEWLYENGFLYEL